MKLFFRVDDADLRLKYNYYGNFALQMHILSIIDVFYGEKIRKDVEKIINSTIGEDKLKENLRLMSENIHKIQTGRF